MLILKAYYQYFGSFIIYYANYCHYNSNEIYYYGLI